MRYKINGSPSHTPPLLSGFVGGGAERGAFFFLSPLLHTTLILWGKSSSFFSGRRRGTAPSSSEAPEAGLEIGRFQHPRPARPPARSTGMHCTLQSHCKKSAMRANKKKPCLRKKTHAIFSSPLCRHPHRSGVRVLRVLEGHLHQRHLGAQLHLAHRRQAVQGVLRKSRSFTFLGGSTVFFVEYVQISNSKFA